MSEACTSELSLVPVAAMPRASDRAFADRPHAPGWFDSSWDLQCGLEVRESWSDSERVHGWIEDFLRTQRAIGRTASPSASTAIA